jgi:hypothetical protein
LIVGLLSFCDGVGVGGGGCGGAIIMILVTVFVAAVVFLYSAMLTFFVVFTILGDKSLRLSCDKKTKQGTLVDGI